MLTYPLTLSFKIVALHPQVSVTDADGQQVAYVKQRAFKLREDVTIFADATQQEPRYRVRADRILDFNAAYTIALPDSTVLGSLRRRGGRSLWSATYEIYDAAGEAVGAIREKDPWVKVLDGLLEQVPIVNMLTGYFLNPTYVVEVRGEPRLLLRKQPALLEGRFTLDRDADVPAHDEPLVFASVVMMLMLERGRG